MLCGCQLEILNNSTLAFVFYKMLPGRWSMAGSLEPLLRCVPAHQYAPFLPIPTGSQRAPAGPWSFRPHQASFTIPTPRQPGKTMGPNGWVWDGGVCTLPPPSGGPWAQLRVGSGKGLTASWLSVSRGNTTPLSAGDLMGVGGSWLFLSRCPEHSKSMQFLGGLPSVVVWGSSW